jgi:hypothetical protein
MFVLFPSMLYSIVLAIIGPELVAYTMGAGFGPGAIVTLIAFPYGLFCFVLLTGLGFRAIKNIQNWNENIPKALVVGIISILSILLPLAPAIGGAAIRNRCDRMNREIGMTIVDAMKAFEIDHGEFPRHVTQLVPSYLSEVPSPVCFDKFLVYGITGAANAEFEIVDCADVVLTVPDLSLGFPQRYNFADSEWSMMSFLDGICYFP